MVGCEVMWRSEMCMWRSEMSLSIPLFLTVLRWVLLLSGKLAVSARLADQRAPCANPLFQCRGYKHK